MFEQKYLQVIILDAQVVDSLIMIIHIQNLCMRRHIVYVDTITMNSF